MIKLDAVEILGYWLGGGTATQLGQLLGVSREHAQRKYLGEYKTRHPHLIVTKQSQGFSFKSDASESDLRYAPYTTAGFLDLLRGLAVQSEGQDSEWLLDTHFMATSLMVDSGIKVDRIQRLMHACFHRLSIQIDYVSKRKLTRIRFSPHCLVACAMRPHFRGYFVTENHYGYIDIVPGRIRAMHDTSKKLYVGSDEDREWHAWVDLTFLVNRDLPENIQNIIIEENEGSDILKISKVRRAVELYVCRELEWRFVKDEVVRAWKLSRSTPRSNHVNLKNA